MTGREALILVHILLLVYWLGADLGQFVISFWVRKASLSAETRGVMAKVMLALDVGPRIALVGMLPVGFSLARTDGLIAITGAELAGIWAFAAVWVVIVVRLHLAAPTAMQRQRTADLYFRVALSAALIAVSVLSLTTGGPFRVDWLAIKVGIFGILIALGVAIRITVRPFGSALGRILSSGSTPEAEAMLEGSLRRTRPLVVAIWVGLIAAAALGVAKP